MTSEQGGMESVTKNTFVISNSLAKSGFNEFEICSLGNTTINVKYFKMSSQSSISRSFNRFSNN